MKKLLALFFALCPVQALGCVCIPPLLLDSYQNSEFVAVARIIKLTPSTEHEDYHVAEIEPINVYKGSPQTTLTVLTQLKSKCSFFPPENSVWLIFAGEGKGGGLIFGSCSASLQIDGTFDSARYPNANTNHKKTVDLKLATLDYLSKIESAKSNPYRIIFFDLNICTDSQKGFDFQNRFAVYQFEVNEDLSIEKINALKDFDNPVVSGRILECLHQNARINTAQFKKLPAKTKVQLVLYSYPTKDGSEKFISLYD
ncbi:hypothetical protein [Telluribacter humicola]|uniref:hypothetical protein n=1 Tax=Telluribacter humicola TaxID=1720261 RepID=UPI001A960197|nr:hypothetical protein [Telluribacter humicola]